MEGVIKTDQNRCYDEDGNPMDCGGSGQDGEMRFGVKWPIPRFEERGTVVIDRLSGLMWPRDAALTEYPQTWQEALDFIGKLNREAAFDYRGWRLPKRRELFNLISHDRINPALPSEAPFENVFAGYYWTADTCSRFKDQAWYIHLGGGRVQRGMKHGSYMVWPARCHLSQQVPGSKAGCRSREGSKDPCRGAARYIINNGAVYDRLTGLGWATMEVPASGPLSWTAALDYVGGMNAGHAHDHADWRLPNIRELESLIDVRRHTPALTEGHLFGKIPEGCWSSTTSVYEPRYAWVLYLQDGAVGVGYKKHPEFYAWAVRGGIQSHSKLDVGCSMFDVHLPVWNL
jgi:hypothetical protein